MRIAELAQKVETTSRMLRYYEAEGLLNPQREPNGYREYTDSDVKVARQIVVLSEAGLTLAAIKAVLPCAAPDASVLRACPLVEPELRTQLQNLRARISALTQSADSIQGYLDALEPA